MDKLDYCNCCGPVHPVPDLLLSCFSSYASCLSLAQLTESFCTVVYATYCVSLPRRLPVRFGWKIIISGWVAGIECSFERDCQPRQTSWIVRSSLLSWTGNQCETCDVELWTLLAPGSFHWSSRHCRATVVCEESPIQWLPVCHTDEAPPSSGFGIRDAVVEVIAVTTSGVLWCHCHRAPVLSVAVFAVEVTGCPDTEAKPTTVSHRRRHVENCWQNPRYAFYGCICGCALI